MIGFSAPTRAWFTATFASPTQAQVGAWDAARADADALVVAPTGSGKTLAAFLWAIDRLASAAAQAASGTDESQKPGVRVLYVSPLKALAVDVERNLRVPLAGIGAAAHAAGTPFPTLTVGLRSGDTEPSERRRLVKHPPDILITTPESLYLMLTSSARSSLTGVEHVVIDEIHSVAGTKRGSHLALSLERLDALLPAPARRIGLSATVRPVEDVARFLVGSRRLPRIVQPTLEKRWDLSVQVPVEDLAMIGAVDPVTEVDVAAVDDPAASAPGSARDPRRSSIWPHVEEHVLDLVEQHRSTLVFVNSRRLAERLCARLNELAYERLHGEPLGHPGAVVPAEVMGGSAAGLAAPVTVARAHHGSVSREERAHIEDALKSGTLPAVVATGTLELGIDMGAVDLVIQVESPPSVASGLQRVGRAGHQVGAVSRGVLMPKHRGDLLHTSVVVERMLAGDIESLRVPANPLDVLAQQVVAMVAVEDLDVDELFTLVRRSAPFQNLPRSAFEATLDMLAGRYPSDAFAELRPRVVWDRTTGALTARPGAARLAVTSGGTIPDRGLYGVFLLGEQRTRVGELDEEMVYESRVGDVFTLGASSWRIEEITHDRVNVSPAPGQPGRLPFWKGDAIGRPYELGRAIGEHVRRLGRLDATEARASLVAQGLDEYATTNLLGYLAEQREATGAVPDDRTLVIERFRDELGDWRVVLHSPFGARVHAPWALAISTALTERFGVDAQVVHSDDGIVVRLPDTEDDPDNLLPLLAPASEGIEDVVVAAVQGSAVFAARFRECAARALLLPRRDPGKRSPLWQQRQRSSQLLQVAAEHHDFPIVLEAMRECVQDVYDLPALTSVLADIEARRIDVVEVTTTSPSPFASSMLFDYVASFLYETDAPLAERRAQALTLDSSLLAELLGRAELRDLLDADVIAELELSLQRLTVERATRSVEASADLLRELGPLTTEEAAARGVRGEWLDELVSTRRVVLLSVGGHAMAVVVEDLARLRDAAAVPPPPGVPDALLEAAKDPLGDLVARYARTHGPFTANDVAVRFGIGTAVVTTALATMAEQGRVVRGEFTRPDGPERSSDQWCDASVLRRIRRLTLARLRDAVEPVPQAALARFLPRWQSVQGLAPTAAVTPTARSSRGAVDLRRVIEQLDGYPMPAAALESMILPARILGYEPSMLDALTSSGEVMWCGRGGHGTDLWVSLHLAESAPLTLPLPTTHDALRGGLGTPSMSQDAVADALLAIVGSGGGHFATSLLDGIRAALGPDAPVATRDDLERAVWNLVAEGVLTNDTLAPVRSLVSSTSRRTPARPAVGLRRRRLARPPVTGYPDLPERVGGRWSLLPVAVAEPSRRIPVQLDAMLDRYGVLTRGAVRHEALPGGFAQAYRLLSEAEQTGQVQRAYVVDGLGASQFAVPGAIDHLRAVGAEVPTPTGSTEAAVVALSACDPANPFGAALPWPAPRVEHAGHRPARRAGALVVMVEGRAVLYVEKGGRSLLTWSEDAEVLDHAAVALSRVIASGALGRVVVQRTDGSDVLGATTPIAAALGKAGFVLTPRGLRQRAGR